MVWRRYPVNCFYTVIMSHIFSMFTGTAADSSQASVLGPILEFVIYFAMPDEPSAVKKPGNNASRNRKGRKAASQSTRTAKATEPEPEISAAVVPSDNVGEDGEEEEDMCHICAEPMGKKAYAVAECNHRTCYTCALRLRALYKRLDCTFCKSPQPLIIVTASSDRLFESYAPSDTPFHDTKLAMDFETSEMMEDCLLLLRFNCPDVNCDHVALSWPELKHHTKTTHDLLICDLCIRHKKIFAHEHTLYTSQQLGVHLPTMRGGSYKKSSAPVGEIDSHPVCEFCHEALYGDDEQFAHMRQRHEECFVCKAAGVRHQYFQHYNSLERHFREVHYPCPHPDCQAQKFVVFSTAIDLQGHVVEKHGETMSTRDLKDARRIQAEFAPSDHSSRGRSHRTERRNGPPPSTVTASPAPVSSADSSAQTRRRQGFSSNLSSDPPTSSQPPAVKEIPDPPTTIPESSPEQLQKHEAFLSRIAAATHGSPNAIPAIKAAIRSYRSSESSAQALVDTFSTILEQDLDSTGTFISSLVDLLDDEEKKSRLLATWRAYKLEHQQQFPSLTPAVSPNYAGVTGGRAIQVKQLQSGGGSRRRVWDRVEQAASSSPVPLPVQQARRTPTAALGRNQPGTTPWSKSAATNSIPSQQRPARSLNKPPAPSSAAFPSLPPTNVSRPPKEFVSGQSSLRAITGPIPSTNAWTPGDQTTAPPTEAAQEDSQPSRKKKPTKQTLFTLGSHR